MYYSYYYSFNRAQLTTELENMMLKYNKPFNEGNIQVITLLSNESCFLDLYEYLNRVGISYELETIYSEEEIANAQWLTLRSKWRFDYPQPETWSELTYDQTKYCRECGFDKIQIEKFRLKRAPKWGKRHFLQINGPEYQLFADNYAKDVLINEGVKGFTWLPVKNAKNDSPLDDIQQMMINSCLTPGFVINQETVQQINICNICGHTNYIASGKEYYFYSDAFQNLDVDIINSYETFGPATVCVRLVIINQKFYQILKNNKIDSSLVVKPIILIDRGK